MIDLQQVSFTQFSFAEVTKLIYCNEFKIVRKNFLSIFFDTIQEFKLIIGKN